ncbi:SusC/RagA family TonB-linked outer membrane protein [Segetibacter aerophilus]|uniref:SusC/RagA family TonB-linked outer membrane protein n=1 Tax=Segetibacter aerophilus TaxID=670293 RepID=A0A512BEK4_9BACT|nr:TonB-dependent receptor [Segetibacter aerophilus]GEO10267.1 SusC/RagA family TonB-linked outer membrane protein [Segetibacter aerophilus]
MKQKIMPLHAGSLFEPIVRISQKMGWVFKLIVILQLFSFQLHAQTLSPSQIRGRILSPDGTPLQGASVIIAGTKTGSTTDEEGRFSISVPNNRKVTLEVSSVGFATKTLNPGSQTDITITLEKSIAGLDDVVVIGYGTARKKDVTGSVATVSSKRLMDKPVVNLGQALENKVAGVQVISNGAGVPGSQPMVRIRGTNSINSNNEPLYVVDGVVGVGNPLSTLNPNDILSLDVLKDASATAIYGARGANGVIIITTKRGKSGKPQLDYNGSASLNVMQRHLYTMTSDQLMYTYMQAMANGNKYGTVNPGKDFRPTGSGTSFSEMPALFKQVPTGSYVIPLIGKDGKSYAPIYNTNWESLIFRPSVSTDQSLAIRGGNENAKYSMSLGYTDQNGLMKQSFFRRYTGRLTSDFKVSKWLNVSTSLSFIKSKQTNRDGDIPRSTAEVWSILPVKYPTDANQLIGNTYVGGRWGTNQDFNVGEQWFNVLYRRQENIGFNHIGQVTGSFTTTANITKDLTFKSDFSIDYNAYKQDSYSGQLYGSTGSASVNTQTNMYWQNENYFNYNKRIGTDHNLSAVLGLSWSQLRYQNNGASNSIFLSDFYGYSNLGAGAAVRPGVSSADGSSALNSYFGRINYSYKDKYLFTLTGREDGSSKFGSNNKYGFFPSAGVAWRVSQENFMKNVTALSNLKLRGSWGRTGNQEIGSYVTQSYISTANVVLGGTSFTGLYPSSVANNDLKWETTEQYDAGLEFGILHDRVNLSFDYYHKLTSNMLLQVPLPLSMTSGSVTQNYGKVQNAGFEFTLNTRNIETKNLSWTSTITATNNVNKVVQLGPTGAPIYAQTGAGNGTSALIIGQPIGSFFGLTRLGVFSTEETSLAARYGLKPGDLKFLDRNNDGKIDLLTDGDVMGNAFPHWLIGFNNSFTYKNFDVGVDIQIVQGVSKAFVHESAEDRQLVSGGLNSSLDAWRPDHQNTMVAQFRPGNGGAYYQSYPDTHMMYDASFIRGANAVIGYTIPDKSVQKWGLSRFRVYLSTQNFFLRTKAAGYDPEGSSLDKQFALVPNTDKYQYPVPTVFSFGVNTSF